MSFQRPGASALALLAFALVGCSSDAPVQVDSQHSHHGGVALASLSRASAAQTLSDLTRLTAPFHFVDAADSAGYKLFIATPLTTADGCISSASEGGMGYHYTRGDNLGDDSVSLLDPEFLVYAPKNGARQDGDVRRRLAAFDYFIPYSPKWPGPTDATFVRAPRVHDFSTMRELPDTVFAPSRFQGWMFHIWLWEQNPGGMFTNWNASVPRCEGSTF